METESHSLEQFSREELLRAGYKPSAAVAKALGLADLGARIMTNLINENIRVRGLISGANYYVTLGKEVLVAPAMQDMLTENFSRPAEYYTATHIEQIYGIPHNEWSNAISQVLPEEVQRNRRYLINLSRSTAISPCYSIELIKKIREIIEIQKTGEKRIAASGVGSRLEEEKSFSKGGIETWFKQFIMVNKRRPSNKEMDAAVTNKELPVAGVVKQICGEGIMQISKRIFAQWELGELKK